MYDPTEVIAEFNTPGEAQLALSRLEAEGIAGTISGDLPNAAGWSLLSRLRLPSAPGPRSNRGTYAASVKS